MLSSVFDFRIKSLLLDTFTRNESIFVDHCRFIYLDQSCVVHIMLISEEEVWKLEEAISKNSIKGSAHDVQSTSKSCGKCMRQVLQCPILKGNLEEGTNHRRWSKL